ncbi:ML domain-containing protein [Roridomyces roridus]|uniref:ML domain-containing protein n=1 Tax=Roridomyces roridus TaxID=1738132 RepID=A0AAD7BUT6_9AGAR|nr:ML domain-containing protein [Roridomyces roridus]
MLRHLILLFLTSLFLTARAADWEYVDCGLPGQPIQIESISLSPDPPVPAQDLTVSVKAQVTETIEEGATADVTVKLGLVKLLQKKFAVCEEARNGDADVQCPVTAGSYDVVQTVQLPKEIPKAKFIILVRGNTVDGDEMLCLDLRLNFMSSTSIFNSPFKVLS